MREHAFFVPVIFTYGRGVSGVRYLRLHDTHSCIVNALPLSFSSEWDMILGATRDTAFS